jgi:tagaturonate reductase
VVVSNVTEAAFRLNDATAIPDTAPDVGSGDPAAPLLEVAPEPASPRGFPAKLTDLLHARFIALPDAPLLFVIPTELIPDNGPLLASMVDTLAKEFADGAVFREWIAGHVRFCSSLIDRITTGMPADDARAKIEAVSGFHDDLLTVTEPHAFWAIEGDPVALRDAFPVDAASDGTVVFAADITTYRERKLRMLNGVHTAMAPLALRAGLHTVRELMVHAELGPFVRTLLLDEIAPSTPLPHAAAIAYGETVLERFANPWLEHEWRVIATNQTAKLRLRVVPSLVAYIERFGTMPARLVRAFAASLRYSRAILRVNSSEGEGWWQGAPYRIVDVDFDLNDWHWRSVDSTATAAAIPETTLARFAASVLSDDLIWGRDLTTIPGLKLAVVHALMALE